MSARVSALAALFLAVLPSTPAAAMSLTTQLEMLAFNEAGTSVLVRATVHGPEGGGQTSYQLWSTTSPHRVHIELSSNLSAGAGPTAEKVSTADCAKRAKELSALLKTRGFTGVTARPDRCTKRAQVVTVEERHLNALQEARFRAKGNRLAHDGLEARFRNGEIAMYRDESKECALVQPKRETPAELHVWGSKGNKLVFVLETTASGDEGLLGLCGVDADGKLKALPTAVEK